MWLGMILNQVGGRERRMGRGDNNDNDTNW